MFFQRLIFLVARQSKYGAIRNALLYDDLELAEPRIVAKLAELGTLAGTAPWKLEYARAVDDFDSMCTSEHDFVFAKLFSTTADILQFMIDNITSGDQQSTMKLASPASV